VILAFSRVAVYPPGVVRRTRALFVAALAVACAGGLAAAFLLPREAHATGCTDNSGGVGMTGTTTPCETTTATTTTPTGTTTTPTDTTTTETTPTEPDTTTPIQTETDLTPTTPAPKPAPPPPKKKQPKRPAAPPPPKPAGPSRAHPPLNGGPYVFPVYGPASFNNTFGVVRAGASWHHGDDIFAPLGAPVLAVADGTLFLVGWNQTGGNRLWLRDRQGNYFYYAHLAAFSTGAVEGAQVHAGEVLGFVGATGDATGSLFHLYFEVHPVSTISLGYDGAVDPTPYLRAWAKLASVHLTPDDLSLTTAAGWSAIVAAPSATAAPGAILLQSSDISTAPGLERHAVARALTPRPDQQRAWRLWQMTNQRPSTPVLRLSPRVQQQVLKAESLDAQASLPPGFLGLTIWDTLAQCESSGDWSLNDGSGFYGGLQFTQETWLEHGGSAYAPSANVATREEQIAVAERTLADQGWVAWPACSLKLGLR
jgi:murein DD-endopeptidase MepM/ murein hydrolase activator NlpD